MYILYIYIYVYILYIFYMLYICICFFVWRINIVYLENCEVFQHTVHHVFLGQTLELEDEVDHVLAHGAAMELVDEATALELGVLGLYLLHHLLSKAADFCGHLDGHVLRTLVRGLHPVEGLVISLGGVQVGPELHQEETILGSLVIQLFQPFLIRGELVLDLLDIHGLQEGVGGGWAADVDK